LPVPRPHQKHEKQRRLGEYSKAPGAHKGCNQSELTLTQRMPNASSNLSSTCQASAVRIILLDKTTT
jgi:hypothetical protein